MLRVLAAVVASASLAPAALAQDVAEICRAAQELSVGHWVEYEITGPMGAGIGGTMRQAVVDGETVDGRAHYWFESKMSTPMGDAVVQMLVPAWPYDPTDIKAMVMQMAGQPAMRVPGQMLDMMRSQMPDDPSAEIFHGCEEGEVIGWESVTVPAGTFRALHIRPQLPEGAPGSEVWVTADVPFGLVKVEMSGPEGGAIVLAGHGTDAASSISERPGE